MACWLREHLALRIYLKRTKESIRSKQMNHNMPWQLWDWLWKNMASKGHPVTWVQLTRQQICMLNGNTFGIRETQMSTTEMMGLEAQGFYSTRISQRFLDTQNYYQTPGHLLKRVQ